MNSILETLTNTAVAGMLANVVESTKATGARFAGLTYTSAESGETCRYNLVLGVNMVSLYKSDARTLDALRPTLAEGSIESVACDELIASVNESLEKGIGNNSAYTLKGYYQPVTPNGEVKLHQDDKGQTFLYLRGYVVKRTVIVPGTHKAVKSSPKTLAKKNIEKSLKRGRIRTFKINVANLHGVKMNGAVIEIE